MVSDGASIVLNANILSVKYVESTTVLVEYITLNS